MSRQKKGFLSFAISLLAVGGLIAASQLQGGTLTLPFADASPFIATDVECNNGVDDDGDGRIDYFGGPAGEPGDPECDNYYDESEGPAFSPPYIPPSVDPTDTVTPGPPTETPETSPGTEAVPSPQFSSESLSGGGCTRIYLEDKEFELRGHWEHKFNQAYYVKVYVTPVGSSASLVSAGYHEGGGNHKFTYHGAFTEDPPLTFELKIEKLDHQFGVLLDTFTTTIKITDLCNGGVPDVQENMECNNNIDDDADTLVDWDGNGNLANKDTECTFPWSLSEYDEAAPSPDLQTEGASIDGCIEGDIDNAWNGDYGESLTVNGTWEHSWNGPYFVEVYVNGNLVHKGTHGGTGQHTFTYYGGGQYPDLPEGFSLTIKWFDEEGGTQLSSESTFLDVDDMSNYCEGHEPPTTLYWQCNDGVDNDQDTKIDWDGNGTPANKDPQCTHWFTPREKEYVPPPPAPQPPVGPSDGIACEGVDIIDDSWSVAHGLKIFPQYGYFDTKASFRWTHNWGNEEGYYVRTFILAKDFLPGGEYDPEDMVYYSAMYMGPKNMAWHRASSANWNEDHTVTWNFSKSPLHHDEEAGARTYIGVVRLYRFHDDDIEDYLCEHMEEYSHPFPE